MIMQYAKFKLLTAAVICLSLISCDQIGNKPNSANRAINSVSNNLIGDGNYKLKYLNDDLKTYVCAGFGYDDTSKECHHTIDTPVVQNIKNLSDINPDFNLKNDPVINNKATVSSIDYYSKINFYNDKTSYLVLYPKMTDVSKFKGVVVYFHPTLFNKQWAPSTNTDGSADRYYAAIFASQGYVVILPDYQGMGNNWQEIHPYIISPDLIIRDVKQLLTSERNKIIADYKPQSEISVFAIGFSEGAGYAVNFARNTDIGLGYKLKASIGLDGAYDLSGTTYDYLTSNVNAPDACAIDNNSKFNSQYQVYVNLTKPALMSLVMPTYNKYVSSKQDLSYGFNTNFYKMETCSKLTNDCRFTTQPKIISIGEALQKLSIDNNDYLLKVGSAAIGSGLYLENGNSLETVVGHLIASHQNSLTSHNSTGFGIFNANVINESEFKKALETANAYKFSPQTNIVLVSLKHDSIVTPNNTDVAYEDFTTTNKNKDFNVGKYKVNNNLFHSNLTDIPLFESWKAYIPNFKTCYNRLDHPHAEPFLDIIALKYIETIDEPKKPTTDYVEQTARLFPSGCDAKYDFTLTQGNAHNVLFDNVKQNQCENIDIASCIIKTTFPSVEGLSENHTLIIDDKNYKITYRCAWRK